MPGPGSRLLALSLGAAVVLGTLVHAPSLGAGLHDDDYVQRAMLAGAFPLERDPLDLFWFSGRSLEENRILRDAGYLPWWTAPELRLGMLRPLSSALVWLDDATFGMDGPRGHLHSFAWWILALGAAALVFARVLPPATAAIAVVLWALDEAHALPLAWLANRSTLVATAFGLATLWAHLRWREEGWRPGATFAALGASLALAAGEYALGVLVYIGAFELVAGKGSLARRALALLPVGLPTCAYLVLRVVLGHGVRGSGYYVSPTDPVPFAVTGLPRIPALAGDVVLGLPAAWWNGGSAWRTWLLSLGVFEPSTWHAFPDWRVWHLTFGAGAIAALAWLLRVLRARSPDTARHLPWLALGALGSLVPAAGSLPSARLLAGAGFAIAAIAATALGVAWQAMRTRDSARLKLGAVGAAVALVHVVVAADRSFSHARGFRARTDALRRYALEAEIPEDEVTALDVLVIQGTDFTTAAHVPWVRWAHGLGLPRSYRRLSGAMRAHDLTRTSADTIELEVLSDDLGDAAAGSLYRPASSPLTAGAHFELAGLTVDVLDARDGNPARVRFRFDDTLDASGSVLVLVARPEGLQRLDLPPVGQEIRLPLAWAGGAP